MATRAIVRPRDPGGVVGILLTASTATDELSEEDQQLKSELDMLVERLTVRHMAGLAVQGPRR